MSIQFNPTQDRVLIKRLADKKTTAMGIVIPDNSTEKPIKGEVIAVGKGKFLSNGEFQKVEVKVGDTVMFAKYAGTEVKIDDNDYVVMREEDIIGTIG
jgi:chaperonin GroES